MDVLATKTQKYWQYTFLWIQFLNKCQFLFINYRNLMISNWITIGPVKYENTVHQKLFFVIKISLQSSTKLIIRKTSMNIRIILAFNGETLTRCTMRKSRTQAMFMWDMLGTVQRLLWAMILRTRSLLTFTINTVTMWQYLPSNVDAGTFNSHRYIFSCLKINSFAKK